MTEEQKTQEQTCDCQIPDIPTNISVIVSIIILFAFILIILYYQSKQRSQLQHLESRINNPDTSEKLVELQLVEQKYVSRLQILESGTQNIKEEQENQSQQLVEIQKSLNENKWAQSNFQNEMTQKFREFVGLNETLKKELIIKIKEQVNYIEEQKNEMIKKFDDLVVKNEEFKKQMNKEIEDQKKEMTKKLEEFKQQMNKGIEDLKKEMIKYIKDEQDKFKQKIDTIDQISIDHQRQINELRNQQKTFLEQLTKKILIYENDHKQSVIKIEETIKPLMYLFNYISVAKDQEVQIDQQKLIKNLKEQSNNYLTELNKVAEQILIQQFDKFKQLLIEINTTVNKITDEIISENQENQENQEIQIIQHNIQPQPIFNINISPSLSREKDVRQIIEKIYDLSCRKRYVDPQFKNFVRGIENLQELYRNYGIRSSNFKNKLSDICQSFRYVRGDGNCFYTAFGYQYLSIVLFKYSDIQFNEFIQKYKQIKLPMKITLNQVDNFVNENDEIEMLNEFIYRLYKFRQIEQLDEREQVFHNHFGACEAIDENIDGCLYGLSSIFFRNLANYAVEQNELKNELLDRQNLLIWETECNSNEIVIQSLAQELKVFIQLLFFENGGFNVNDYNFADQNNYKIILLIKPGHYNIGINENQQLINNPQMIHEDVQINIQQNVQEPENNQIQKVPEINPLNLKNNIISILKIMINRIVEDFNKNIKLQFNKAQLLSLSSHLINLQFIGQKKNDDYENQY